MTMSRAGAVFSWVRPNLSWLRGPASVTIPVIRTGGDEGTVTVNFATSDETATADEDYDAATAETLTFQDGETSKDISVRIIDDDIVEEDETFSVALSSPTGGATLSDPVRATVTIEDNDSPPLSGSLRLEASKLYGEWG